MSLDTSSSPQFSGFSNSFDTGIAEYFNDINVAVILNHIIYWLRENKKYGINQIEGKTWMYQTLDQIADTFEYLNERQVKYCMSKLLESGLLIKGYFNKNNFDRTPWYALADETQLGKIKISKRQNCPIEETKLSQGKDNSVPSEETILSLDHIYRNKRRRCNVPNEITELASSLFNSIKKTKSDIRTPNLDNWAKDIQLMVEKDSRSPERIKEIIEWLPTDSFWCNNVLSAGKLREKFDQLELQMQKTMKVKNKSVNDEGFKKPTEQQEYEDELLEQAKVARKFHEEKRKQEKLNE